MSGKEHKSHLANVVAERTIIGASIRADTVFFQCAEVLQAEHFTLKIHREIYSALRDVYFSGKGVSLSLLVSILGEEYDDGASTANYLGALLRDAEGQGGGVLDYVDEIIDLWRRRKAIEAAKWATEQANKLEENSADLIALFEQRVHEIGIGGQTVPLKAIGEIAGSALNRANRAKETGVIAGFDTGLPSLDAILGRIQPGDLGVLGASQGDAKTILAVQIARRAAKFGPVLMFEFEMRDEDLARRILAAEGRTSVRDIEEGTYDFAAFDSLTDAVKRMRDEQFYIDDRPKLKWEQMRDRIIAMKRTRGLILVIGDHLRLAKTGQRFQNKFDRIEFITAESKALAKELDIAFIWLSQRTRMGQRRDDGTPQITDLDGGSSIEQDADWVLTLFRRDRWLRQQKPFNADPESREFKQWEEKLRRAQGKIEMMVLKRRRGGDGEMREAYFNGSHGLLEELER